MRLTVKRIFGTPWKEANPINDFKPILSSLDIARSFYSYLYLCAPPNCPEKGRTRTVEQIDAILRGRKKKCNAISKNLLICDRKRLISPHGFYLGVSGSGKSMGMKDAIVEVVLGTEDDVIIIDAEREYRPMAQALGGEVIEISSHSPHHISPLDLSSGYADDENPVAMKSEIITSILEQQMDMGRLTASHKSIIDRCTANIYQAYFHGKGNVPMPLLTDWREEVLKQVDPEAREIALAAELITEGSLRFRGDSESVCHRHSHSD